VKELALRALFHVFERSPLFNVSFQKGTPAGRYDQKSFEPVSTKVFSSGVTELTVLKSAVGRSELDLVGGTVFLSDNEMRSNPSTTEILIVPVTLATDADGVQQQQVRAYVLPRTC